MPLRFQRLGRSHQAQIGDAEALAQVPDLEDALWVATAAPIDGLRADKVLLAAIDSDADGRIRSDEVRAAIRWLLATLKDRSGIREGQTELRLAAVDPASADGPAVLDAAKRVLGDLGRATADTITLAEVRQVRAAEEARGLSSAGKVLPAAAGDDAGLKDFLAHVIEVTGGEPHPAGEPAVTGAALDTFLAQATGWLAWHDQGTLPDGQTTSDVLPLGAATAAAHAATEAIGAKLEQYFLLCDAVHLDPALAERAWIDATGTDLLDPAAATALLERAPLARPRADGTLDLSGPVNPAWRARVAAFTDGALRPLLGADRATVDRAALGEVRSRLAAWAAWNAGKPDTRAGDRGADAARAHTSDATLAERTRALLAVSEVAAVALDGVKLVEKVLLFQGGLLPLVNNLVSVPDLYSTERNALFERGTLVMDGRVFDLSIRVNDAARAEKFAAMSPLFVMFVRVGDKGGALDEELMVPVTAGEREHLIEGMWGVFFDLDGRERHAQVRKIAVSPISIKEAVLAPFRRLADTVQSMFDKAAASQQDAMGSAVTSKAQGAVDATTSAPASLVAQGEAAKAAPPAPAPAPEAPAAAPPAPAPASSSMGSLPMLLAGAGVALAAVGSALAYVIDVFWQAAGSLSASLMGLPVIAALPEGTLTILQVVSLPVAAILVLLGMVAVPFLIYATPVAIAAWFRLRRRDLATLLEGSGWAINTRLYLDRDLAVRLTRRPPTP